MKSWSLPLCSCVRGLTCICFLCNFFFNFLLRIRNYFVLCCHYIMGLTKSWKFILTQRTMALILIAPYNQNVCGRRCWFEFCTWHPYNSPHCLHQNLEIKLCVFCVMDVLVLWLWPCVDCMRFS